MAWQARLVSASRRRVVTSGHGVRELDLQPQKRGSEGINYLSAYQPHMGARQSDHMWVICGALAFDGLKLRILFGQQYAKRMLNCNTITSDVKTRLKYLLPHISFLLKNNRLHHVPADFTAHATPSSGRGQLVRPDLHFLATCLGPDDNKRTVWPTKH